MSIEVQAYDPSEGREADVSLDAFAPWQQTLFELESARAGLLDAAEQGELTAMPTSFPSNRLARTLYLASWVVFKRGVPPRRASKALPCFDPDLFVMPGEDPRWHSDGQTAHLRAPALKTTILAMTKLAPFVAAEDRPRWCRVRDALKDLQSRGLTLQCSWLED